MSEKLTKKEEQYIKKINSVEFPLTSFKSLSLMAKCINIPSTGIINDTVLFIECWAKDMQYQISNGAKLEDIAEQSFKDAIEIIGDPFTNKNLKKNWPQYSDIKKFSVQTLADIWEEHGAELKDWYDEQKSKAIVKSIVTQFKKDADKKLPPNKIS